MAIHTIPIRGTDKTVTVDSGKFSDEYYSALMQEILEIKVNKRSTKFGPMKDATEKDLLANAEERVTELYAEKTRRGGGKKGKKAETAVETEMLRLAKIKLGELVKSGAYTDDKGKVIKWSNVSAAERTKGAKALIEQDSEVFRKAAEANLSAAANVTLGDKPKLSLVEDPKLVKARAESAAKKKATKEGKTAPVPPAKKAKPAQAAKH